MGIQGLCGLLDRMCKTKLAGEPGVKTINFEELENLIIGVDTSNLIYRYLGNEEHMVKVISKICYKLLKNGIFPLFVFDSRMKKNKKVDAAAQLMSEERKRHEEEYQQMMTQLAKDKEKTVNKRFNLRRKNRNYTTLYSKIFEYRESNPSVEYDEFVENVRNFIIEINSTTDEPAQRIKEEDVDMTHYYSCPIHEVSEKKEITERMSTSIVSNDIYYFKALLDFYGIPYVEAYGEADGMLAQLCNENIIDGVISDDSDLLAFGCKRLFRNFDVHSDEITEYNLEKILNNLELTYSQFLDMCILMGTDFNERLRKSPEVIYNLIKERHDMAAVIEGMPKIPVEFLSNCMRARDIFYRRTPDYYIEYTRGILNISHEDESYLSRMIHLTYMNIRRIVQMQKESRLTNFVDYLNMELSSSSGSSSDSEPERDESVRTLKKSRFETPDREERQRMRSQQRPTKESSTERKFSTNSYRLLFDDE